MMNYQKYSKGYFMPPEMDLEWAKKDAPDKAPVWCSVDMRDGNQALIIPMNLDEKLEFYKMLIKVGFKEIEIGFPAASETEYEFLRRLVEENLIPDDVTIQVLTQAREHIIKKTFEALKGVKNAIVHVYNSTSVAQREQVFRKSKEEIKEINWNVLWLVAGGFALGYCLQDTGLAKVLIQAIPFGSMSVVVVLIIAGLVCYFLSNFISNSATAALLIPILIVVANGMADPAAANNAEFLAMGGTSAMIIFIAVCASIAMLFPISTPPNAIASATGMVETKDMTKVGLVIGVIGFILGYFWLTKLFPFA